MLPAVHYERLISFTDYALTHQSVPYHAADHDAELNNIRQTLYCITDYLVAHLAMPEPAARYVRLSNFTTYALANPLAPYNAAAHDAELAAIRASLDGILAYVEQIQRDDEVLRIEIT